MDSQPEKPKLHLVENDSSGLDDVPQSVLDAVRGYVIPKVTERPTIDFKRLERLRALPNNKWTNNESA